MPETIAHTTAIVRQAQAERVTGINTATAQQGNMLSEAQSIAESIVGPCSWRGAEAYIRCPGFHRHTTANAETNCKVVCEPIPNAKPGVYCFHVSCAAEVDAASYALRSALGKRSPFKAQIARRYPSAVRPARSTFDPAKLERVAQKLGGVDAAWFAERSPKQPGNRTPASFLHELYQPGESVVVFDVFRSQGQALWTHRGVPFNARELDSFRTNKKNGVWFLANPVTGKYLPNDDGHSSRRSWQNVTSWRYLVLESDSANPAHWLSALAQLPLPIAAIYTSGGKSIHALVKVDAISKAVWDAQAARLKPPMITLGADRKVFSAVRLTRLPGCERVEKQQMQTLLYLNPNPDETPICELLTNTTRFSQWTAQES